MSDSNQIGPGNDAPRMVEALLFAADKPLSIEEMADRLPANVDIAAEVNALVDHYTGRGVNLVQVAGRWQFRTAPDLSFLLRKEVEDQRRLSRAGVETLAIIAYHQPATRAEIEEVRGVALSKGTLDVLMEAGWVRPKGRRQTPGRPVTYGTTDEFLIHFGLANIKDLPGVEELKAAGLLETVDSAMERYGVEAKRNEELDDDEDDEDEDQEQLDLEEAMGSFAEEAEIFEEDVASVDLDP